MRPHTGTGVSQPVLVVERFIDIMPGETCGAPFSALALENTYWRAHNSKASQFPRAQPGGQAYLLFEAGAVCRIGRLQSNGGCLRGETRRHLVRPDGRNAQRLLRNRRHRARVW